MGRPDPLESRYEGPWYREVADLPTKGTAPITQYRLKNHKETVTPEGLSRHLAHSYTQTREQGQQTRQDSDHYK